MQLFLQDKIFKYITVILILTSFGLIAKEVFFGSGKIDFPDLSFPTPPINIKTDVFEKFDIGSLTPFEQIASSPLIGRDNPFEPYSIEEYEIALEEFLANATTTSDVATTTITTTTPDIATTTPDIVTTTPDIATTTEL